ncbi:MAG TPA: nucleotidyltransferase family protein [Chloroflexia bacterium]|nr:nucleotidyltransferase family protein [Chloroflexia bacterium]
MPPLSELAILILAAGRGTRMGRASHPKLLLPWRDGKSILWHTIQSALSLGPREVVVVVRPDLPEMVEALGDLPVRCVPNPRYEEGMGTSLAVGIGAVSGNAEAALLMLGDEPDVPRHVVERLIAAYQSEGKSITIPLYGKHVGPPTIFARRIFPELMRLEGDMGARSLIARHPDWTCMIPFDEADRPHDIDTQEDYQVVIPDP